MTMEMLEQALQIVELTGAGDFEGRKPECLVTQAEAALGLRFPPTYRRFLLELGCGNLKEFEVFGLIDDNFESSSVPNGIWLTLNERRNMGLQKELIIVGEGGDGTYYALDLSHRMGEDEAPVVLLSVDGQQKVRIADSFGQYFLERVRRVI